jgi:hypothetical protein
MIGNNMRRKIATDIWEQIETAYASGIGLREIARNMGIPEGTVLARANARVGGSRFDPQGHSQSARMLHRLSVQLTQPQYQYSSAESVMSNVWRPSQSVPLITSRQ